jgi:hypothetical protein
VDNFRHRAELMAALQQMLLAGGDRLRLDVAGYTRAFPGGATAGFRLDADGFVYAADDSSAGVFTQRYPWIAPQSAAVNYDVRWGTSAGVVDSTPGAEATNLPLTVDRQWSETNNAAVESCAFLVRIHRTGDAAAPLVSATITLEADGSP